MALHGVCKGLVAGGGFRKQDVQHNDFRAGIGKLVNQPGMEVSVPGPAPECVQAVFIDAHQSQVVINGRGPGGDGLVVKPEIDALFQGG